MHQLKSSCHLEWLVWPCPESLRLLQVAGALVRLWETSSILVQECIQYLPTFDAAKFATEILPSKAVVFAKVLMVLRLSACCLTTECTALLAMVLRLRSQSQPSPFATKLLANALPNNLVNAWWHAALFSRICLQLHASRTQFYVANVKLRWSIASDYN